MHNSDPNFNADSTKDGSSSSVLSSLNSRGYQRRRRRPPKWAVWVNERIRQGRDWLKQSPQWIQDRKDQIVACAITFCSHALLLLLFSLWVYPGRDWQSESLIASVAPEFIDEEFAQVIEVNEQQPEQIVDQNISSNLDQLLTPEELSGDLTADTIEEMQIADPQDLLPTTEDMKSIFRSGDFGGRSENGRQLSLRKYGGTANSEKAVSAGLKWLQSIQQSDGSWNFAETGPDTTPGRFQRTHVGATSLALLCFLGAGKTHETEGPYQENIRKGLAYIGRQAEVAQGTADLRGDAEANSGMYVQALATICVSEAYALEPKDRDLKKITELAVRFIERAQAPFDGGWRYKPRDDDSDTSVVGWQVMALQSARAAGLRTSNKTIRLVRDYLRNAQTQKDGSTYAYLPNQSPRPSMNAVGLLCRMYTGWRSDKAGLRKGVEALASRGPSRNDMYYNYYATQVLHHWGGPLWNKWNEQMREQLIATQIKDGPATGSWRVTDPHGATAGPIYQTALSVMTLEVYYRHLPLFRRLEIQK